MLNPLVKQVDPNMYRYDEFDAQFVSERVEQFAGQVARRLSGELTEDQFKPLRLMNGLYLQLHAYMLRIAVPYGTLSSRQMRRLAHITRTYDKGFGHFTTRTNLQLNWIKLVDVPAILRELAEVEMHCIQTSGNCVRNITADQFAGATDEEIEDPRPLAEIIRQWSSLHPEFVFLARKFKIAVGACEHDRAALQYHDMAVQIVKNAAGRIGYKVMAGGGMGRTPYIAHVMREFVEREDILAYLEAVLRVYNQDSRRDNIHKQRIKILINTIGPEEMRRRVAREFEEIKRTGTLQLPQEELDRITAYFAPPKFETGLPDAIPDAGKDFADWVKTNVHKHRAPGYAIATITLKTPGQVPGDATADQMDAIADLMDQFSVGEVRVTHEQNLVLPHVRKKDLPAIYAKLKGTGFRVAQCRPDHRHHRLPGPGLLRPGQCPLHPHRPEHRQEVRRPRPPARYRRTQDQDFRLHQCLRPSPCRPYRHPGRGQEGRGILPAPAGRLGRRRRQHRRDHGPRLRRA